MQIPEIPVWITKYWKKFEQDVKTGVEEFGHDLGFLFYYDKEDTEGIGTPYPNEATNSGMNYEYEHVYFARQSNIPDCCSFWFTWLDTYTNDGLQRYGNWYWRSVKDFRPPYKPCVPCILYGLKTGKFNKIKPGSYKPGFNPGPVLPPRVK